MDDAWADEMDRRDKQEIAERKAAGEWPFNATESATEQIAKLRNALLDLCDLHHRTLTGSAKHNPARVSSIHECECLSCRRVSAVLRETEQK